jgi:hypothetical protein
MLRRFTKIERAPFPEAGHGARAAIIELDEGPVCDDAERQTFALLAVRTGSPSLIWIP